jgi:hypothetical protein
MQSIHREQHRHLNLGEFLRRMEGVALAKLVPLGVRVSEKFFVVIEDRRHVDDHVFNLPEINLAGVVVNFLADDELRELVPVEGVAKMDL